MRADERTDWALLQEYLSHGSEAAFTRLVERHMKLVYGTCHRDLQDTSLAEDVTQNVFLLLARKAPSFTPNISIPIWLFHTARLAARDARKCETRRKRREEAMTQTMERPANQDADWQRVETWVNDALAALPLGDRRVVLLRYFEGHSLQEIADELGTTEGAASKRVYRALEKLRQWLLKKGIPITTVALTALLARQTAMDVPLTAQQIAQNALQQAAFLPTVALTINPLNVVLKKGIVLLMEAGQKKALAICAAVLCIGIGVTVPILLSNTQRSGNSIGTFTDNASGTGKATNEDALARTAINKNYQDRLARVNNGDITGMLAYAAPEFVFYDPHGGSRTLENLSQNRGPGPAVKASITVQSYAVNGNQAVVTYLFHIEKQPGNSTGRNIEETQMEDRWEKRDGQWLNVSERRLKDSS